MRSSELKGLSPPDLRDSSATPVKTAKQSSSPAAPEYTAPGPPRASFTRFQMADGLFSPDSDASLRAKFGWNDARLAALQKIGEELDPAKAKNGSHGPLARAGARSAATPAARWSGNCSGPNTGAC